jgi:uncharacterized protein
MKSTFENDNRHPDSAMSRRAVLRAAAFIATPSVSVAFAATPAIAQSSSMSAQEAAELVRRGYRGFATADMALLTQLFDADSTWETPGKSPVAGVRKGRDNVFAQFGAYGAGTDGTFKAELLYVTADAEGHVVGVHRNTGARKGRALDTMCCLAFVVKSGRIVSGKEHFLDLHNWDAFWA